VNSTSTRVKTLALSVVRTGSETVYAVDLRNLDPWGMLVVRV
jgi:hypothetical protein